MLSFTGSQTLYGQLTDNSSTANLSFGATMCNEGMRTMLSKLPWPFLEKTATVSTVAGQQSYQMPGDMARLIDCYVLVGTYKYLPTEVTSADDWSRINNPSGISSDAATNFYTIGNNIYLWPTPSTSSNTVTFHYIQQTKDLSVADYTTGTIVSVANGGTAVVGAGTSWTAGMAGSFIRITSGNGANIGDGIWYKIAAVGSTTTLTLEATYKGTAIAVGSASYTIGNCYLIPEKFQIAPVYYAVSEYWRKQNDASRADRYEQKFQEIQNLMVKEEGTKSSSVVLDDGSSSSQINPNLGRFAI